MTFAEHLENTSDIVQKWPEWKRSILGRPVFEKKHGTKERWLVCDCDECVTARAPLDQALAEERARREAPPAWHVEVQS